MKCRSCNKTFNFITKALFYDEATGLCTSCLKAKLAAFKEAYHKYLLKGQDIFPTHEAIQAVADEARALDLKPSVAFRHMKRESIKLLQRAFVVSKHDGIITPEEEAYLRMLQRELYLEPNDYPALHAELEYITLLQRIRAGDIPTVQPRIILPSTELCYWDSPATYRKVLKRQIKLIPGNLIVTNKKVRFVSPHGGFEFSLSKIAAVDPQPKGIYLQLTRQQGNGYYEVQNSELLVEILRVVLNQHNRQVVYKQAGSRSIPQEVKVAVYQRDAGRCVECQATDYLEYDHIIPFSKGGATSVKNLQLLCRRRLLRHDGVAPLLEIFRS